MINFDRTAFAMSKVLTGEVKQAAIYEDTETEKQAMSPLAAAAILALAGGGIGGLTGYLQPRKNKMRTAITRGLIGALLGGGLGFGVASLSGNGDSGEKSKDKKPADNKTTTATTDPELTDPNEVPNGLVSSLLARSPWFGQGAANNTARYGTLGAGGVAGIVANRTLVNPKLTLADAVAKNRSHASVPFNQDQLDIIRDYRDQSNLGAFARNSTKYDAAMKNIDDAIAAAGNTPPKELKEIADIVKSHKLTAKTKLRVPTGSAARRFAPGSFWGRTTGWGMPVIGAAATSLLDAYLVPQLAKVPGIKPSSGITIGRP